DHVTLSTKHHQRKYMQRGLNRAAKFMPQCDSPYTIMEVHSGTSTYTLDLPNSPNIFPTFHISQLHQYTPNNPALFPGHVLPWPGPMVTSDSQLENFFNKIIDERKIRCGKCEALDIWEKAKKSS
ncbi:hypothetical protein PAXRUDRAFT_164996, partial [Paxillus rubicundulus Ve08.2h10]